MDEPAIIVPRPPDSDTSFTATFARFADEWNLPDLAEQPLARVTFGLIDFRRRVATEFFSAGLVHGEAMRKHLEKLIPATPRNPHRLPCVPDDWNGGQRSA